MKNKFSKTALKLRLVQVSFTKTSECYYKLKAISKVNFNIVKLLFLFSLRNSNFNGTLLANQRTLIFVIKGRHRLTITI